MFIKQFEDLDSWKLAVELVKDVYQLSSKGQLAKDYGLKDQFRRAAVSIVLNIAEGFDSGSPKAFITFLKYSFRSCSEVKSILYLGRELQYFSEKEVIEYTLKIERIKKIIGGTIKRQKTLVNS